jgi:hypothetical protein
METHCTTKKNRSKKMGWNEMDSIFYLDFPNTEVKQAFAQDLLMEYTSKGMDRVHSYLTTPLRLATKKPF